LIFPGFRWRPGAWAQSADQRHPRRKCKSAHRRWRRCPSPAISPATIGSTSCPKNWKRANDNGPDDDGEPPPADPAVNKRIGPTDAADDKGDGNDYAGDRRDEATPQSGDVEAVGPSVASASGGNRAEASDAELITSADPERDKGA
jgi:hypothetical protein